MARRVSLFRRGNAATTCINTSLRAALKQHKIVKMFTIFYNRKIKLFLRQKNKKRKVKRQKVTNKELKKVLDGIRRIPNESEREAVTQIVLKAAAESITLETLKQVTNTNQCKNSENTSREKLKFSKTEIEKLPPALQKLLEKCGRNVACRTTEHGLYQARFRRNGYNVEVADKNFSALKEKFLQKLIAADNKKDSPIFRFLKIMRKIGCP